MEESMCRICLCPDHPKNLVSPCNCKGTQKYVHRECHNKWQKRSPGNFLMSAYCPVCKTSFLDVEKREKVGKITVGLVAGMGVAVWLESFLLFFLFALVLCGYKSGFRLAKMDTRNGLPSRWRLIRTGDPVSGLRGGLLLEATDQISSGIFHQCKILLLVYSYEAGAVGLILNKTAPLHGHTLNIGGPVTLQSRHYLHDNEEVRGIRLAQGLYYTPLYNPSRLGEGRVREFYGYAGWSGSQLDGEVASGSWKLGGLVKAEDVFATLPSTSS